jgi:ABC-type multidrug transport system ATPase subunit/pSer/pThr/pTyr-binding forkhead associated (FHA) protein/ABC-type multidrug transport system permease subunit
MDDKDELEISLRGRGDLTVRLHGTDEGNTLADIALRRTAVLVGDQRIPVPEGGLIIGRDPQCDLRLDSPLVASIHARIEPGRSPIPAQLVDLGTGTGVYLNGEHFSDEPRPLRGGDSIAIGDTVVYFVTSERGSLPPIEVALPQSRLRMDSPTLTLGRAETNDLVLDHARVSPLHAEIHSSPSGVRIKDMSRGGDGITVNGQLVTRAFLQTGDEIAIGPFRLVFDGQLLQQRSNAEGLRLDAELVTFDVGDKRILQPTTLTMVPGELVAVIGPSGAGKSTLLKSLCGVNTPSYGRVTIDGEPVRARLADLGYVPQDEIVHPLLGVREALTYAAELRLPQDQTAADRDAAVTRVLDEVGLIGHAETRIAALSGGQRKRAGVASELISEPGMLFLDEPTTGLDPGLEQRLMQLFRSLAEAGRATMIVTHATRSLRLCDKVVVMGEGGHMCFSGSPEQALEFFGVEHFDDLYGALEQHGALSWAARFAQTSRDAPAAPNAGGSQRRRAAQRPVLPQAAILIRRRLAILMRDRRNLAILGGQVPVIGLLLALLFHYDVFSRSTQLPPSVEAELPGLSAQLLFLLVTVSLWFGSLSCAREIVKERAVVQRETAIGVRVPAYILSKAVVMGLLTGCQTLALAVIVLLLRPLHEPVTVALTLLALLVLTTWAGAAMGLIISASVHSEDQAASFVPLLLIPQLLFGGSLMPVHQMGFVLQVLSKVVISQWAFAGLGNVIHLNARISADPAFVHANHFGHSFFAIPAPVTMLVILVFLTVCSAILHRSLSRAGRG